MTQSDFYDRTFQETFRVSKFSVDLLKFTKEIFNEKFII